MTADRLLTERGAVHDNGARTATSKSSDEHFVVATAFPSDATPRADASTWQALYPFQSHWIEVNGRRLHYLDEGPAGEVDGMETLLFVHGNPTWSFHWRKLVMALRDRYRCLAPDHIGCGLSEKGGPTLSLASRIEHLLEWLDQLQLRQVTLVAQDWGGAIGLGVALRRQERFRRLVFFNTAAFPPPYVPWRIRACRIPFLGKVAVRGGNLFSRAALTMTLARSRRLPRAVARGYLAPYDCWAHRQAVHDFVMDIPNSSSHPTWQTLAEIEAGLPTLAGLPICLIWGMRDWCFRPECLERLSAVWPQATVHRLDDVGHWVVEDAPQEATRLVEEFLRTTSPQIAVEGDRSRATTVPGP